MYKLYRQKQRSRQQIDFRENKIWGIDVIASQKHCFSDSWKGEAIQKMTVIYSRGNVKHSLASSVNHNQNMFCLRVEEMYKKKRIGLHYFEWKFHVFRECFFFWFDYYDLVFHAQFLLCRFAMHALAWVQEWQTVRCNCYKNNLF